MVKKIQNGTTSSYSAKTLIQVTKRFCPHAYCSCIFWKCLLAYFTLKCFISKEGRICWAVCRIYWMRGWDFAPLCSIVILFSVYKYSLRVKQPSTRSGKVDKMEMGTTWTRYELTCCKYRTPQLVKLVAMNCVFKLSRFQGNMSL